MLIPLQRTFWVISEQVVAAVKTHAGTHHTRTHLSGGNKVSTYAQETKSASYCAALANNGASMLHWQDRCEESTYSCSPYSFHCQRKQKDYPHLYSTALLWNSPPRNFLRLLSTYTKLVGSILSLLIQDGEEENGILLHLHITWQKHVVKCSVDVLPIWQDNGLSIEVSILY